MSLGRAIRHLLAPPWLVRRAFSRRDLADIEAAIGASEQTHRGQIRFAVEGSLDFVPVLRGLTARERALHVFSLLRVWDTHENIGVLIYVQLVDHALEIVADRGIAKRIEQSEWEAICRRMENGLRSGRYQPAVLDGIAEVSRLLAEHFPAEGVNPDELPNRPVVL